MLRKGFEVPDCATVHGRQDDDVVRLPPYFCLTCGYNLTGNVSGICPECGSIVRDRLP
jgi:predicted RNA-binding Zn-ribbon protein involved in translation (DUF1610 family)